MRKLRLSRKEIYTRDNHECQYCGRTSRDLTLDHVIPQCKGGQNTWDNLVTACRSCNLKKGGRNPKEAGMKLLRAPFEPKVTPWHDFEPHLKSNEIWRNYMW